MAEEFGFEVYDLTGIAEAGAALEESVLEFDRTEYTPFEELLQGIATLPDEPVRVKNYALSVRGRVANDRMETYLAHCGESSSLLREVLKSPRHYLFARESIIEPENTRHFDLGTFIHAAILEPSRFAKVRIEPKASRATLEGMRTLVRFYLEAMDLSVDTLLSAMNMAALKETLSSLEAEAAARGYSFVTARDSKIIDAVRIAYKTYGGGILPHLMRYCKAETSMYCVDPLTRLKVKVRPDGIILAENLGANIIVSVKTTSEASPEAFMRQAAKYRYDLAEGMYLDVASHITGRQFTGTLMIVAQTVIPFQIAAIWLDAEDLQVGKYKYRQAMDIVRECRTADSWPGFDCGAESGAHGILQLRFPDWIKAELKPQYLNE